MSAVVLPLASTTTWTLCAGASPRLAMQTFRYCHNVQPDGMHPPVYGGSQYAMAETGTKSGHWFVAQSGGVGVAEGLCEGMPVGVSVLVGNGVGHGGIP